LGTLSLAGERLQIENGVCLFAGADVRVRLGVTVPEARPADEFTGRPTVAIFGAAVEVR
jgi:hypothetical protein